MSGYPESVRRVVEGFKRLPGVGERGAARFAFHLLYRDTEGAKLLGEALVEMASKARRCSRCRIVADTDPCWLCSDPKRDTKTLCVVEGPEDVVAIENTGAYRGLYFVLGGVVEPLEGRTIYDLGGELLKKRVAKEKIEEVIVATSPTTEGEATLLEIEELLQGLDVVVSRIARGLPSGTYLHAAGPFAIKEALTNRKPRNATR